MRYVVVSLVQTAGVILLAFSGILLGWRSWRVRSRAWLIAYAVPLLLVAMIAVPRWLPRAELIPPFKWIMAGRTEFAVLSVTEAEVTVGDPLKGLRTCTPEEFDKEWRRCAIVID